MKRFFALFLVLLPIAACTSIPTPETTRERLAMAEATYQAVIQTVGEMAEKGILRKEHVTTVREAIIAARTALNTWHRFPDSVDSMVAAEAALRAVRGILNQIASQGSEA